MPPSHDEPTSRRRVVVTGCGLVTPLGLDVLTSWNAVTQGVSAVGPIGHFDASALPSRIAAEVRDFDPRSVLSAKDVRKTDRYIQLAIAATDEALRESKFTVTPQNSLRVGVCLGTAFGGLQTYETAQERYRAGGYKKVSAYFIPSFLGNMAAGRIAMRHGIRGVNLNHSTACASGAHAIGEALHIIRSGRADVMIAGGSEAPITPVCYAGFCGIRALSERNDEPQRASRPFDLERDGFVMGEGAGALVLEDFDHARQRGASIYAELCGYGASADAYHLTQPHPGGPAAAMQGALDDAGLAPEAISYVNAHGTSTLYNDHNETLALKMVFGSHVSSIAVSANKSMMGHSLGAAGAVEAVISVMTLVHQVLPPTINYEVPDPLCDLDYVPNEARKVPLSAMLCNSYGFGGANASLLFHHVEEADGLSSRA